MTDETRLDAAATNSFSIELFARWPDMDFNQHMRNAAYLGASEDTRMQFLASHGFTMDEFRARNFGPVVLEDRIVYKKELRLLERFRVELTLAAMTQDARRMKVRNTFYRQTDSALVAVVESVVMWLDLSSRRPLVPPEDLRAAWHALARADDFEWYQPRA